jgi:uncharacterized protein YraI
MTIVKLAALAGFGMLALSAMPAEARPWSGYAIADVNERAGPSTLYPAITVIPAGAPILIYGCLGDYSWCDVSWGPYRGWMAADYLETNYGSQMVPLPDYIGPLGIPLITFEFDSYWGDYYRDEPFYRDSYRWRYFHPDHNPPPPPRGFFPPPGGPYGHDHHDFDHYPSNGPGNFHGQQGYQPPPPPPHGPQNFDGPPKPHNFYKPYNGNGQYGDNGQFNTNGPKNGQYGYGRPPKDFRQQEYGSPSGEQKPGCYRHDGQWVCPQP